MLIRSSTLTVSCVAALLGLVLSPGSASAQPFQDAMLYTAPVGTPSALGGPTPRGEVSILREQFFDTTPPDMTGSGLTLVAADPTRDGLFSQIIFVRSGPVADNSRSPETEATIVFPATVTVIGVVVSTGGLLATDTRWGLAPGVNYTASARQMEVSGVEYARIVVRGDGTTAVEFRTDMNNTPFTDEFRVLIDHGTAWVPGLVATVEVTTGDDVNIGATDGGRTGEPTGYTAPLPLTHACGDSILAPAETCDDGNAVSGDGCSDVCLIEPGFVCGTTLPSVCAVCFDTETGADTDLGCPMETPICLGSGTTAFCAACIDDTRSGTDLGCSAMAPVCDTTAPPHQCLSCEDSAGAGGVDNGCTAAAPLCDTSGRAPICVSCVADSDCDDGNECTADACTAGTCGSSPVAAGTACAGGVCDGDATAPMCLACVDDATGTMTDSGCGAGAPLCDTSGGAPVCVACIAAVDCDDGNECTADACVSSACVSVSSPAGTTCSGGVCDGAVAAPICLACIDDATGTMTDSGCSAAAPLCDSSGGAPTCLECTADRHCGAGTICGPAGACVPGCNNDPDCAGTPDTPVCDVAARACVECVADAECPGTRVCTRARTCRAPDTDGDGVPDDIDLDDDNDGIPDDSEIDSTLTGDADGDGVLDFEDPSFVTCTDTSPMDGVCDSLPMEVDFDGDGIANHLDLDADGDGIADIVEGGGDDTDGDGRVDTLVDSNGDGWHDAYAVTPLPLPNSDGDAGPDFLDVDADGDGVTDTYEGGGVDVDMDGAPDDSTDADGDGIADALTGAGALPTPDSDMDGTPDYQDPDDDGDGVPTIFENPIAQDTDMDGTPDYLDPDDDGDGALTVDENADPNGDGNPDDARDSDGDGVPDYLDPSTDPVVDGGVGGDAGVDAGARADGGPDVVNDGGDGVDGALPTSGGLSGGALCRVTPGGTGGSGIWLLGFLIAFAVRRRRR